ncbi:hypothetical protein GCM10010244_71260 [Streptomyces coeruleorubidus]|nr:hypothetical protein GCM10010244_71260 [Streptomyces bellus]
MGAETAEETDEEPETEPEEETSGDAEGDTDTGAVLKVLMRVRESGASAEAEQSAARAQRKRDAKSAGRATHAARIADEVHMDPPPQAHTGVGHAPEYTMTARTGQLTVTMRTHGDNDHVTLGVDVSESRPTHRLRPAPSPVRPPWPPPPRTGRPGVLRSAR